MSTSMFINMRTHTHIHMCGSSQQCYHFCCQYAPISSCLDVFVVVRVQNHKYFMSFECDPSHCNWMLSALHECWKKNTWCCLCWSFFYIQIPNTYRISIEEILFWSSIYACTNFPYCFRQSCSILSFSLFVNICLLFNEGLFLFTKMKILRTELEKKRNALADQ